jgi:hypothetical protein
LCLYIVPASSSQARTHTYRPHFVDFLFHRNLSERSLFLNLLMAFKQGDGYDDKFFTMFLTEAITNDRPRVAVDVITKLLFLENGECSVHALKLCPKMGVIVFVALVSGILNAGAAGHAVSDDMRLLFEVAIRFQFFALRKELLYLKTIDRLFKDNAEKVNQFMQLVQKTNFLQYAIDVCNHNLASRAPTGNSGRASSVNSAAAPLYQSGVFNAGLPLRTDSYGNMGCPETMQPPASARSAQVRCSVSPAVCAQLPAVPLCDCCRDQNRWKTRAHQISFVCPAPRTHSP